MNTLFRSIIIIALSLFANHVLYAQSEITESDLLFVDKFEIANSGSDDMSILIKLESERQKVSEAITKTRVNSKQGFNAVFGNNNNLLTLNFSQKFTNRELNTLLAYCGIKLESKELQRLQTLLN